MRTALLLSIMCFLTCQAIAQDVDSIDLSINKPIEISQQAFQYSYFQVTVSNPSQADIFTITASSDVENYIGIFVSASNAAQFNVSRWPDWNSYTEECFYSSIDTCALALPDSTEPLTIYISIVVGSDCSYTLEASITNLYQVRVGHRYTVKLNNAESAVLRLNAEEFSGADGSQYEEVSIFCNYISYETMGHFQLIAAVDQLPNPIEMETFASESMNIFSSILLLESLQNQTSFYYILLEGQNGTEFNLTAQGVEQNPQLHINESVSYLASQNMTYTYNGQFPSQLSPLSLDLYVYRGFGSFSIDYCDGLYNFSFHNSNGENGEVLITSTMRQSCLQSVSASGGLLIENLLVSIGEISWEFGYSIYLYEGDYSLYMLLGLKEYGSIEVSDKERIYELGGWGDEEEFSVNIKTIVGNITYEIQECVSLSAFDANCSTVSTITVTDSDSLSFLTYTHNEGKDYRIVLSPNKMTSSSQPTDYKFSMLLRQETESLVELNYNSPLNDIVSFREYNYYYINVSKLRQDPSTHFSNSTTITVKNTVINGDVLTFYSLQNDHPNYSHVFDFDSDVSLSFDGIFTIPANLQDPDCIYLSVLGDAESVYHLQFVLNTSANVPAAYLEMSDDAQNDYTLSSSAPFVLLKYTSHIIPYSIVFSPQPNCIRYGAALPLSLSCQSTLPKVFTDQVIYLNVSQSGLDAQQQLKFSAFVNSGNFLLSQDRPLLIACERECYEMVIVLIASQSNQSGPTNATLVHSGMGFISRLSASNEVSNDQLILECVLPPCSYQINASLPYGGSMEVSYLSELASRIEWRSKPMVLPQNGTARHFYSRLYSFDSQHSYSFYSTAADLIVLYSIISLNESQQNSIDYSYPSLPATNQTYISKGNPLHSIHIVDIPEQVFTLNNCSNFNVICVATFSVLVNPDVQYSNDYISTGIAYFSSNSYTYDVGLAEPMEMWELFSVSYFKHEAESGNFTVHLKPISNCRPILQTLDTSYAWNFYKDTMISPISGYLRYRILSDANCLFRTELVSKSPNSEVLFLNIKYDVDLMANNRFSYTHYYYEGETLSVDTARQVGLIAICDINITAPSRQDCFVWVENTQRVLFQVDSKAYKQQYLIYVEILITDSNSVNSLMVHAVSSAIVLLHNQEQVYKFDPTDNSISANTNATVAYEYHSTSNFLLFLTLDALTVRVTISDLDRIWTDDGSAQILSTTISNSSQPWLVVNALNSVEVEQKMGNYLINCTFLEEPQAGQSATLRLHIEEDGINGLSALYSGISMYDAFLYSGDMNCYKYQSPLIMGEDKLAVDIHFPDFQIEGGDMSVIMSLHGDSINLHQSTIKISPNTLRTIADFYASQIYKICFVGARAQVSNHQYSVVVNVPSMPMLYKGQTQFNNNRQEGQFFSQSYQMFEFINYNTDESYREETVITVTNCLGKTNVLSSSSYQDMLTGVMTQINPQNVWTVNGISSSLVDISHGYYYIGIANASPKIDSLYTIDVSSAGFDRKGSPVILQRAFEINWKIQATAYPLYKGDVEYVGLDIPTVIEMALAKDIEMMVERVEYSMYLMNLEDPAEKKLPYKIDTYSRCPHLLGKAFTPAASTTITDFASNPNIVTFTVPIDEFKPEANISVKAQVFVSVVEKSGSTQHILTYYYGSDEIYITNSSGSSIFRPVLWIVIIIIIILAIAGCAFLCRCWAQRRNSRVDFEMAQFGQMEKEMEVKSTRKPINKDTGYGQFVDEVII